MPDDGDTPSRATVEGEMQQARRAGSGARKTQDAGVSDATVINRLDYASFNAVQVYDRGYDPTSHGGVLARFGSEVVAAGDAKREHGRFLNQLVELRRQTDYGYEELDKDVDDLLDRTT